MLRTRPPRKCSEEHPARLACIRHAASVDPEPGSNSPPIAMTPGQSENPPASSRTPESVRSLRCLAADLMFPTTQPRPRALPPCRHNTATPQPPDHLVRSLAPSSAYDVSGVPTIDAVYPALRRCQLVKVPSPTADTPHPRISPGHPVPSSSCVIPSPGRFAPSGARRAYLSRCTLSRAGQHACVS